MKQYLETMQTILSCGKDRTDRTGTGTRSMFALQMRFNLKHGFPAMTTKRLAWKSVVSELLWFIEGSIDERRLCEILHGTRDESKKTIWTANAQSKEWKSKAEFNGDVGRSYGRNWRDWFGGSDFSYVDQLQNIINGIKDNPYDRRHLIISYNPAELDNVCLPPCHFAFQFYVESGELSCHMNMRSADYPLGVPFNIASYALLTHMIAQITGLGVGELIVTTGDSHIYLNQIEGVEEQLTRIPRKLPTLWLNPNISHIDHFTMKDITLANYDPYLKIKFPFSV